MKQIARKALAMTLTLALLLTSAPAALASYALGSELHTVTQSLGEGVEVTRQYLWSATYSDLRTEHYLTYTPAEGIRPALLYGDSITGKQTLTAMAQSLEREGKRVLGGINGDYYVVATGAPLGMVLTEGELRSTPQYDTGWALGFLEDGTAFIGQPGLSVTATFGGQTLAISGGINKVRNERGGYYLLTGDFAATTLNTSPGIDVILRPLAQGLGEELTVQFPVTEETAPASEGGAEAFSGSEELTGEELIPEEVTREDVTGETTRTAVVTRTDRLQIGGRVSCEVVEVLHSTGKIDIPAGCYVLTIHENGNEWLREQLSALTAGERVEIDVVSADARWKDAVTAVGGMYKLVTDGKEESGLDKDQAPRSAVGVKADGSTVFYTVDGRRSGYSVGAGMDQVARRLIELGCVEAVCLDGGGSTTLGVTWPDSTALGTVNRPSDGKERANSNALFLVSEREATGVADHFYLTPNDNLMMAEASLQLTAAAVDTNGFPMAWEGPLQWSVEEGQGTVTEDGLFTAGKDSGLVTVAVTDGMLRGTVCIQVVRTPHTLRVSREGTDAALSALHVEPGGTVDLTAGTTWWNLPLSGRDENFIWTADPAVGTVDETGRFTAVDVNGKGYLTVSAGEKSVSIPVTVSGHILPLEDFEDGVTALIGTDTAAVTPERDLERVRFGKGSARIDYRAGEGKAIFGTTLTIPAGEKVLSLWVRGDGSGALLTAGFADSAGGLIEVELGAPVTTGWQQLRVDIPEGAVGLQSIAVSCGSDAARTGTFWLDQLTTSNGQAVDNDAPVIELSVENGILQAVVSDDFDGTMAAERITVSLDGQPLDFTWDAQASRLTLALPQGTGKLHRVTVTAADRSGNLTRVGCSYTDAEEREEPFPDMEGHWAREYTAYLYQQGVTTGVAVENGFEFCPDRAISRGEFALMLARWLGLDPEAYAEVELPFADAAEIPDWMLPAVRAMYAEGIMKGSQVGDQVYANVAADISRTESMTLLGRTQTKGYPAGELDFADADQVPDWALDHVKSLVTQGVVNGYNGLLTPNAPVTRAAVAKMLVEMT